MTIKSSGSSLSFSEIETEFGANGSRSLGGYRTTQSVGSLSNLPLDGGIPTSGQIKFSDFYSKQLNVVVNCHSGSREDRKSAKNDKWNNNDVTVIGGFRSKKESGSKIIINVNKKFCSNKDQQNRCALRTGSWDGSATVQVDIGGSAQILGAGGGGFFLFYVKENKFLNFKKTFRNFPLVSFKFDKKGSHTIFNSEK